jgi:alpha-tubulin suppressor-like RCC1 family protein
LRVEEGAQVVSIGSWLARVTAAMFVVVATVAITSLAAQGPPAGASASTGLYVWGDNDSGELGDGNIGQESVPTPEQITLAPGVSPTAVAAGQYSGYAIGSDHNLYAWGQDGGQLGDGSTASSDPVQNTPEKITLAPGVTPTAIAAGWLDGYAIGSDGNLYAWGDDATGEIGNGTLDTTGITPQNTPTKVSLPVGVTPTAIAAGYLTAYAIGSDDNLYAWGWNGLDNLGDGISNVTEPRRTTPEVITLAPGVTPKSIAVGYATAYAIGSDGNLYAWGNNCLGAGCTGDLGDGTTNSALPVPEVITLAPGVKPVSIAADAYATFAIGSDDNLYAWGDNSEGELGDGAAPATEPDVNAPEKITLAPGITPTAIFGGTSSFQADAIGSDGDLYAWGNNIPTTQDAPDDIPDPVSVGAGAPSAIAANENAAYAIASTAVAPAVTTNPQSQSGPIGTTLTFTAAASGTPAPSVEWQLSVNGGSSWIPLANDTSTSLTTGTLISGVNGWEVEAVFTNSAGSVTTNPATVTVAPASSVILPANNAAISGTAVFDAAASAGTTKVQFWLDCVPTATIECAAEPTELLTATPTIYGWIATLNTLQLPDGPYTLQANAFYANGASTLSAPISLTTVNPAPTTAVILPGAGATVSGTSVVLDATASASTNVVGLSFNLSGGSLNDVGIGGATPTIYGWIVKWNSTTVPNGTYTLHSFAIAQGNGTPGTSPGITVTVSN